MKIKAPLSLTVTIVCSLLIMYSPCLTQKWNNGGAGAVISWDVYGYYLYLPSFFYDDPGKLNNYDYIHTTYHPGGDTKDQAFIQPNTGKYVMNYSCGQAILELPAFAVGHLWAKWAGYKVDGFTMPYQIALIFWCAFVACTGLWVMRKLLLRYFDDWLAGLMIAIICVATNFYNFASFGPMTHAYLFTIYALILYLTDSFYRSEKKGLLYPIIIGILSGLATITRPTEIICAFIPVFWGVSSMASLHERINFFWANRKIVIVYVLAAFLAALPQLVYWHIYAGHWLFFSYHGDDKTFSFLKPHIINVLFSYRKGWFMYTPVMVLSIIGFYQLYKNYRQLFWTLALFTALNIYLVSAWDIWWYGGSFSMRALIQSYPLLMFPMGAFLNDVLRRRYLKYPILAFLIFCTWLNLIMTYQSNARSKYGMMEGDAMTRAYYWRLFGKTDITLSDKKLLDADEEMPEKYGPGLKEIYKVADDDKIFSDSTIPISGQKAFRLDKIIQGVDAVHLPLAKDIRHGWFRVYCKAYFPQKEWNMWDQTQFEVQLIKGKKVIKEESLRIQRVTEQGAWNQVFVDIKTTQSDCDTLRINFWNANSEKVIYINNIKVDYAAVE
jgi:hypothetical protein